MSLRTHAPQSILPEGQGARNAAAPKKVQYLRRALRYGVAGVGQIISDFTDLHNRRTRQYRWDTKRVSQCYTILYNNRGEKQLESSRDKNEGAYRSGEGGRGARLLSDPVPGLRLAREKEKGKAPR